MALSHPLAGATSKTAFVCGLIRGLGSNLNLKKRSQFAKEVFSWANERPPDISAPLDCNANPTTGRLESFVAPNYDGALNRFVCSLSGLLDVVRWVPKVYLLGQLPDKLCCG